MFRLFSNNYFTTTNEIIYTDHMSQKEKKDFFIITTKGLFLTNGHKLNVLIGKNSFKDISIEKSE